MQKEQQLLGGHNSSSLFLFCCMKVRSWMCELMAATQAVTSASLGTLSMDICPLQEQGHANWV